MELKGLSDFLLVLYGSDGNILTDKNGGLSPNGIFDVNLQTSKGATQANITNMSTTPTKVYGSNAVAEQYVGSPEPSIALAANSMPHKTYDMLSGLVADTVNSGMAAKGSQQLVMSGLILHSTNLDGSIDAYIAFPLGVLATGELNLQTDQQTPTVVHDALTFSSQARPSDQLIYQKFYSDDADFDYQKMLAYIFSGYVAATTPTAPSTPTTPPANGGSSSK